MYATCIFCHGKLGTNEVIEPFPVGKRLAFDASLGRLWVVCSACGRWNLSPLDERWEAIESCERQFRNTRVRVTTSNIGLARLGDGTELVRIGKPLRPEFAAWRYGRRFARRRTHAQIVAAGTLLSAGAGAIAFAPLLAPALAMGAISIVVVPGLTTVMGAVPVIGALALRDYLEHDRVIGRLVHDGRVLTVRAKHANDTQLRVEGDDMESVWLDVPHDAGWTRFEGLTALQAAGLLLAGSNRFGASGAQVQDAVSSVEACGDATSFLRTAAAMGHLRHGRLTSLLNTWRGLGTMRLSGTERLALEMSLHEESERRALEGELALLEAAWRDAEELAQIADSI
ncbi:MAG TPA: hypothetical protein VFO66_00635 [Gemmatimonadaceae bacterium]|nr:hypothetical protein [Gemmatimonadaceae bacterium]